MSKIGIMGGGVVADYGHIPAIKSTPGLSLHALFDPDADRLAWMMQRHDIPRGFTEPGAFFDAGVQAVSVTSPAPAHHANVLAAAERGLPVLCEKPLAMNQAQAREMIAAMTQAHAPLFTAFCYRYAGPALKIKALIDDGVLGEIKAMRLIYNWDCHGKWEPDPQRPGQWRLAPHRHGRMIEGGPMVDCGVHQIDLARWWLGAEPQRWHAEGAWTDVDPAYDAPDHVWLHLDYPAGAHAMVEMSYGLGAQCKDRLSHFRYEIIGTEGVVIYDRDHGEFTLHTGQGAQSFGYMPEKDFAGMYQHLERALRTGEPGEMASAEDGLAVAHLARHATDHLIDTRREGGESKAVSNQ